MQTTTVPSVEPPWPEENIYASGGGTSLVFDKSALESLNIHEAALLDHFYRCTITPLFYVECLADLEKSIRSKSTPEQLVGSLAASLKNNSMAGTVCIQPGHSTGPSIPSSAGLSARFHS